MGNIVLAPGCLAQPSFDLCQQVSGVVVLQREVCQQVFTSDVSVGEDGGWRWRMQDRGDGRKSELPAVFFSPLEGINTVRNYLMKFDVYENIGCPQ